MPDFSDIADDVADEINQPKSGSNAMGSIEKHPLKDRLDALDRLAAKDALGETATGWAALRPARGIPPGGRAS